MAALRGQPRGEESPGSTETRCRLTAGGGDPRESATENRPPTDFGQQARVKRWGKSPPRERQRKRHGKPHREQDQIGAARRATGKAGFRAAARVGRARRSATSVPEEWPSIARKGEDRTRLTGRLTRSFPPSSRAWPRDLFCCSRRKKRSLHFASLGSASVGTTGCGQFRGPGRGQLRPSSAQSQSTPPFLGPQARAATAYCALPTAIG
jgi:hypothetical protein